ncbi:MAG: hypothetical protein PHT50_00110 [Candidatus Omnitrophica bacterium]|nr:hypothetical protein [Candidatus Omnitrophota bacterium]
MLKLLKNILLFFPVLILSSSVVFAEDITITTYYPSPYGSYNALQTDKFGVGDNDNSGSLTFADVPSTPGQVWIKGKVGIGMNAPVAQLDIASVDATIQATGSGAGNSTFIIKNTAPAFANVLLYAQTTRAGNNAFKLLDFRTNSGATQTFWVSGMGNGYFAGSLGVGTSTPSAQLHVVGNIMGSAMDGTNPWRLNRVPTVGADPWLRLFEGSSVIYTPFAVGPFYANGAVRFDLAEVTPVKEEDNLEPGDVVCIDKDSRIRMKRSQKAYDSLVAGIVSDPNTASMIIGGDTPPEKINKVKDKKPIALVGRVICKVTTENGPIEIGDLLVTSSKPGHAMKADPGKLSPGMILGKALEPLSEGDGKVIVWVTMH